MSTTKRVYRHTRGPVGLVPYPATIFAAEEACRAASDADLHAALQHLEQHWDEDQDLYRRDGLEDEILRELDRRKRHPPKTEPEKETTE